MALIGCIECGRSISDKAVSCPHCGFPRPHSPSDAPPKPSTSTTSKSAATCANATVDMVVLANLLKDIERLPTDFSAGRTVNGIGTSTGGYVSISGAPGLGIVRKYFCVFFIPLIPLGLYVVKDWTGEGGVFLGRISSRKASIYVNIKLQALSTLGHGLGQIIVFAIAAIILIFIIRLFR